MPLPIPTIPIGSGTGSINRLEQFAWTTNVSGPITVYPQLINGTDPWFLPNPCSFTGPASIALSDGSNVVTAADVQSPPGGWSYTCPAVMQGSGHVIVHHHLDGEKKAS